MLVFIFPIDVYISIRGSRNIHSDLLPISRKTTGMLSMHMYSDWTSLFGIVLIRLISPEIQLLKNVID